MGLSLIRRATLADLPGIEEALLRLKRKTEFVTVKIEFERGRKAIRQCISSPQGFAAVAERDGRIVGVLLGVVTHYWYSSDRYASDLAFYSQHRGDGEELMVMFLGWAVDKNATPLMGQSSGRRCEAVRRFYEKFGLIPIGSLFMGERPVAVQRLRSVQ